MRKPLIEESLYDITMIDRQLITEKVLEIIDEHLEYICHTKFFLKRIKMLDRINEKLKIKKFSDLGLGSFATFIIDNDIDLGYINWSLYDVSVWKKWMANAIA
jgi:hypothetical protein